MDDETKTAAPLTEAEESLQRELAARRAELAVARIGIDLHTRALGRIEAALGLTGAPLGETVNRVKALRLERDAARAHLALVIKYYEAEAREGDGVAEAHWDGLMAAKAFLASALGER